MDGLRGTILLKYGGENISTFHMISEIEIIARYTKWIMIAIVTFTYPAGNPFGEFGHGIWDFFLRYSWQ